ISQVASSRRYKENFRSIDSLSTGIYQLNPLIYDMKPENGGDKNQTGFIAEEFAEVFPSLIAHDRDGSIESIKYDGLHALKIREIQKHQQRLTEQNLLIHEREETLALLLAAIMELQTRMELYSAK